MTLRLRIVQCLINAETGQVGTNHGLSGNRADRLVADLIL